MQNYWRKSLVLKDNSSVCYPNIHKNHTKSTDPSFSRRYFTKLQDKAIYLIYFITAIQVTVTWQTDKQNEQPYKGQWAMDFRGVAHVHLGRPCIQSRWQRLKTKREIQGALLKADIACTGDTTEKWCKKLSSERLAPTGWAKMPATVHGAWLSAAWPEHHEAVPSPSRGVCHARRGVTSGQPRGLEASWCWAPAATRSQGSASELRGGTLTSPLLGWGRRRLLSPKQGGQQRFLSLQPVASGGHNPAKLPCRNPVTIFEEEKGIWLKRIDRNQTSWWFKPQIFCVHSE